MKLPSLHIQNAHQRICSPGNIQTTGAYDTNGNLASDGVTTLGYDAENRLVSANATGMTASYALDNDFQIITTVLKSLARRAYDGGA